MRIPRIIHQIWIQGPGEMPLRYRRWAEGWRSLHPGWEYVLWDDAALRCLLGEHLPELLALYERHEDFAERSDLGRYAVLHVHGGLYVDTDTCCVRPLDPLLQAGEARFLVALYRNIAWKRPKDPFKLISNSLIACVPRHPLWPGFFDLLCRTCAPGTFTPANTGPIKLWPYLREWSRATSEELGLIGSDKVLISYWMPFFWMRLRALLSPRLRVLDFNVSGRGKLPARDPEMIRPSDWRLVAQALARRLRPGRERSRVLRCSDLAVSSRAQVAAPDKLMIVAHPDDETLFGGEALLAARGWTVVCVTHASNPVRRRELVRAMESVGANYTMLDHEDHLENGNFHPRLESTLRELIAEYPYTTVVSHNEQGEYGHVQHRALHRIVRGLVGERTFLVFGAHDGPPGMSEAKQRLLRIYDREDPLRLFRYLAERESLERVW